MPKSTVIFILVLSFLAALLGYNYFFQPFAPQELTPIKELTEAEIPSEAQTTPETEITLEQLPQVLAVPFSLAEPESTQAAMLSWITLNNPGVVTLFGDQISTTAAKLNIERLSVGGKLQAPLIAVDHEGGRVQRLNGTGFTVLPSWQNLCNYDDSLRTGLITASAQELAQVGVEVVFGPVVDVASQSGVLGNRLCATDGDLTLPRAMEFIEIFESQKILSTIKHFPGIGGAKVDLHDSYGEVVPNQLEILVFQQILSSYQHLGVMSTHVGVAGLYEAQPCSLNPACIGDLAKHYPETLVFTDALDMTAAGYQADSTGLLTLSERAVAALKAGNDVLVFGPNVTLTEIEEVSAALAAAWQTDADFQEQVSQSIRKINDYKTFIRE